MKQTISDEQVAVLLNQLDDSLEPFQALDLEYDELGMVAGPRFDDNQETWHISINVRTLTDAVEADLDVEYSFEDLEAGDVLDNVYPEFVKQLEDRYGEEMQLQYTNPEI